jgi:hypothetical protein
VAYHRLGEFDIQLVVKIFDIPSEYAQGIALRQKRTASEVMDRAWHR